MKNAFLGAILQQDSNICHDRLGANIEKGEIEKGVSCRLRSCDSTYSGEY